MTLDTTPKAILAGSLLVAVVVSIAIHTSRPRYAVVAHQSIGFVRMDMRTGEAEVCFMSRDPGNRNHVIVTCDGMAPAR